MAHTHTHTHTHTKKGNIKSANRRAASGLSVLPSTPQRDCYVNSPISGHLGELSCSKGRFKYASTLHPGSSGGGCGCGNWAEAQRTVTIRAVALKCWDMRSASKPECRAM